MAGKAQEGAHPTPATYAKIAITLAAITAFEVAIFYVEALMFIMVPIFLVLSAVKFAMVAMFYMHLKFDSRLFSWFFVGGLTLATGVIIALMTLFQAFDSSPRSIIVLAAPDVPVTSTGHAESSEADGVSHDEATGSQHSEPIGDPTHQISTTGDMLEFDSTSMSVKAGEQIVLEFANQAVTQQHNWVLVQDGTKDEIAALGIAAGASAGWIPEDDRVLAHTELLDPGSTGLVQFTSPSTGTYQFVCTFPGHSAAMFGKFEVSP